LAPIKNQKTQYKILKLPQKIYQNIVITLQLIFLALIPQV